MSTYYILACRGGPSTLYFRLETELTNGECWVMGRAFAPEEDDSDFHPPEGVIELTSKIDSKAPERIYPELTWNPVPLMSRRLVAALQSAGVDNLQTFETRVVNPQGAPPLPEDYYLAVNILGLVAAADMRRSKTSSATAKEAASVDFHALSVDPSKAGGHGIFRLAENVSAVLVHERVRQHVERAGIDTLTWQKPETWAG
ncbi:MAG TPA: DUF1629 domain-containing protein [Polyangiaceae bacterium]|nr:DUF1629 domain-containing protein [Polyangiaceae bacterium]